MWYNIGVPRKYNQYERMKIMKRREYLETSTFHYYNANPKNKISGDCVIRAISTALNQDYVTTYRELFELSLKTGYIVNDKKNYSKYLKLKGWEKVSQPKKDDGTKYTGSEFCRNVALPSQRYIAHIGGHHIVAIIDAKINDTWNSTAGCIGNYWIKEI